MGVCSEPLFASVLPGSPDEYLITLSELPEDLVQAWRHAGFFDDEADQNKQTYTLAEFMNTGCDSHKILYHMNRGQMVRWISLFNYLMKKYPALNELTLHFYCLDEYHPYYFKWTRDDINSTRIKTYVGSCDSLYYFTTNNEKPWYRAFNKDMYIANWNIVPSFTIQEITMPTGLF